MIFMELSIYDMDLSVRAFNALIRAGIQDVASILAIDTYGELREIKYLGQKIAADIISEMRRMGFDDWADRMDVDIK